MKLRYFLGVLLLTLILVNCGGDDEGDDGFIPIDAPELSDQVAIDDPIIREYLSTHFYNEDEFANPSDDFDFQIRFDTIARENSSRTALIDQVVPITINRNDVDQTIYVLNAIEVIEEGEEQVINFADSTFMTFRGTQLYRFDDIDLDGIPDFADVDFEDNVTNGLTDSDNDGIIDDVDADNDGTPGIDEGVVDADNNGIIDNTMGIFDEATTPVWFDLPLTVAGFQQGVAGFRVGGEEGIVVNDDGTLTFNNFSVGAVFIPSGLGFFVSPPPGSSLGVFENLVFTFTTLRTIVTDHDGDGILSRDEDLNGNEFLFDDNTDEDLAVNYNDIDDENDGVPTRLEIVLDDDGNFVSFLDTDNDGIVDYLDIDDDGDGIDTVDEIIITNMQTLVLPDTDNDGTPDYLDPDS